MRHWPLCRDGRLSLCTRVAVVLCAALLAVPLFGQWNRQLPPGAPLTLDGKVNLNGPAPKTADGKPDIAGVWMAPQPPVWYLPDLTKDLKPGEVVMTAWGEALYKQRKATEGKDDPTGFCMPAGVPRSYNPPYPFKIVNSPGLVLFVLEAVQTYRQVFTDSRQVPRNAEPTWMGYSVAHWEGDAFVIETSRFKDQAWLDNDGHPGSDQLRVTERLRRKDFGHMDVQITINDPKAYAKPWAMTLPLTLDADGDLIEFICSENNRDVPHLVGK